LKTIRKYIENAKILNFTEDNLIDLYHDLMYEHSRRLKNKKSSKKTLIDINIMRNKL
jgi:hypothetical protein